MFKHYHYVWLAIMFGWISNYMTRISISPVLTLIQRELELSYTELGIIASAYFYAYMAMQVPAGNLGDRFGRKKIIIASTALWGLFSAAISYANNLLTIALLRFLKGLAHGAYFSNDRPLIASVTPREELGTGYSVSFIGIVTGSFLGLVIGGLIAELAGWRAVFLTFSASSIIAIILLSRFLSDSGPSRKTSRNALKKIKFVTVFRNRELWLLYIGGIPLVYTFWLLNTWGPAIIEDVLSIEVAEASFYASLSSLTGIPAMLIVGKVSDLFVAMRGSTKGLLLIYCSTITLIIFLIAAFVDRLIPYSVIVTLFALSGFFIWSIWTPMYVLVSDIVPEEVRGTTFGILNAIHLVGGITAPWVTGLLKDITGSFAPPLLLSGLLLSLALITFSLVNPKNKLML